MTVAEDASTPAVARSAASSTLAALSSASFTPPDGSLLIIMAQYGYLTAWTSAPTLSCSVSAGGTPTQLYQNSDANRKFAIAGSWYLYLPASPGAITATVTRAVTTAAAGGQLMVRVLTGTTPTPGLLAGVLTAATTTSPASAAVTPTSLGSQLYVAADIDSGSSTLTTVTGTTSLDNWADATDSINIGMGMSTALTSTLSSQTVGFNRATTNTATTIVQVIEALPSMTSQFYRPNRQARLNAANW